MRLKKPVITITLIIILVICLIFFSFVLISNNYIRNEKIKEVIFNFNIKDYILKDSKILESINNYNYPKEVYNYIDNNEVYILKKKIYSRFNSNEKELLKQKEIVLILNNSVFEYENINFSDSIEMVKEDIEYINNKIMDFTNNKLNNYHTFFSIIGKDVLFIGFIFITIFIAIMIIITERMNGIFICSVIFFSFSLYLYYLNINFYIFFQSISNNNYFIDYFKRIFLLKEDVYIVCFILSFVLLLIYMINYLKKIYKKMRLHFF